MRKKYEKMTGDKTWEFGEGGGKGEREREGKMLERYSRHCCCVTLCYAGDTNVQATFK